ncbi:MAG: aminotransferase class I/II-fold pyridoxal phosphate-dependent enzyme [Planctomycetota bacterium]|nr:aminotransferase class I/II-fold pyridoxal phosphate-dependent enzyme [Planctomycetota bacterium]
MSRARELTESGSDIIVLGQAVPDLQPPPQLLDALSNCIDEPSTHLYSPDPGLPELRKALADKFLRENGIDADWREIHVTPGANAAYAALIPAIAEPGEEILLPAPY